MNFRNLNVKSCYESGIDNIIEDFYIPVLGAAVRYDRIAGFFSSASLAVAARGAADFIAHGGKMRLITSPRLNSKDAEIVKRVSEDSALLDAFSFGININELQDEFERNHVKALGWMLATGLLEMRLAIVLDEEGIACDYETVEAKGLFHQKVGVLKDNNGNEISFSGSINETASAWVDNDEEFKVFKAWTGASEYFNRDKERFEELWEGKRKNVKIYNLPTAVKNEIIRFSSDFELESISVKKYHALSLSRYDFKQDKKLFFYQADALNLWRSNRYQLLFEMATGTGKTRTAIAGIKYLNQVRKKLITIVSTPQNTLSKQWKNEIEGQGLCFDESVVVDGSVTKWDTLLLKLLLKNSAGLANHICIFTTHSTSSSSKFTNTILSNMSSTTEFLFVGDETHWLGARKLQQALLSCYKYRIGLSATPSRWFDDTGTKRLVDYYGNKSFEFTIKDALTEYNPITNKHFLVNYNYNISTVSLNQEETDDYKKVTVKISKLWNSKEPNSDAALLLERLLEKRANIIKNASEKYVQLECILDDLKKNGRIENTIIFVSPQQITKVLEILANKSIIFHKLTEKEGTKPERRFGNKSERENIISKFKTKDYQVLVAIKCMDEGIDIPTASTGILLASSTNPREYIQRVGRIIRQSPNKQIATLYDICVDTVSCLNEEMMPLERTIKKKEQLRLQEIAENAINSIDALKVINTLD